MTDDPTFTAERHRGLCWVAAQDPNTEPRQLTSHACSACIPVIGGDVPPSPEERLMSMIDDLGKDVEECP